jgi:hypothetical protein
MPNIKKEDFKLIAKHFLELSKYFKDGVVSIDAVYDKSWQSYTKCSYSCLTFPNLEDLHNFSKTDIIYLQGLRISKNVAALDRISLARTTLTNITAGSIQSFRSVKTVPGDTPQDYRPNLIEEDPLEFTVEDRTYRVLIDGSQRGNQFITLIANDQDPIYDYLDKGYFFMTLPKSSPFSGDSLDRLVSDCYDVNTAHIFALCRIQPDLVELLKNRCFISSRDAEITRLRMLKKLDKDNQASYKEAAMAIDNDYRKNSTAVVVGKLLNKQIEKTTINNILFESNAASYERIRVDMSGLTEVMHKKLNFNQEFDIYTVCNLAATHASELLEQQVMGDAAEQVSIPEFSINNIPILLTRSAKGQRYINSVRINKEEIAMAVNRASCFHDANEYKLFLKAISKVSIKFHDVLVNGMRFKINKQSTEQYHEEVPGPTCPALKFMIDSTEKCVKLKIDDNRAVRLHFGRFIKRAETINKKTDGRWYRGCQNNGWRGGYRTDMWCTEQLIELLLDVCTYEKEVVAEDGTTSLSKHVTITKEDIVKLLSVVADQTKAALEKSKLFLENAVKLTKAEPVHFKGVEAYKVTGTLRTYVVVKSNAKVYDYDTGQYRCVVNDRHYKGVGYDDIAARLLALRNDSVMQAQITTLQGAAQPQYENSHRYEPERDVSEKISSMVDNLVNI